MKLSFFLMALLFGAGLVLTSGKLERLRATQLPPCRACKVIVDSFKKGLQKTSRGKFEGGDAAWEEEKLGTYASSELRLVEIQEGLCHDVEEGRDQCFAFAENNDQYIEEWWFRTQLDEPDLFIWLCIETLEYCCPDHHYGPECLPCLGYPDRICSNNGKCKGAGTRKGSGRCICEVGYDGKNCSICALNYYESYKDSNKLLCSKCHHSCEGGCTKAGTQGCVDCTTGYLKNPERGCVDINECASEKAVCKPTQFCVNSDGSYSCLDCDRSCVGCSGDGPDMCDECAPGYSLLSNVCIDTSQQQRANYITFTRYLTYIGLCIATCIILQRNVIVAAFVGLAVAMYISVSEYMLANNEAANQTEPVIDTDSLLQSLR